LHLGNPLKTGAPGRILNPRPPGRSQIFAEELQPGPVVSVGLEKLLETLAEKEAIARLAVKATTELCTVSVENLGMTSAGLPASSCERLMTRTLLVY